MAALAVAVVASVGCGGSDDPESSGGSTTRAPRSETTASTTTTAPSVDVGELTWSRRPGGLPDATNVNGVTAFEDGFVAAGVDAETQRTAVWTSDDAQEWTKVDADEEVFPASEFPSDIATVGGKLVMVGFKSGTEPQPRAWISSDGSEWTRVDDDSFPADATGFLSKVEAGESGLVALLKATGSNRVLTTVDGARWASHEAEIGAEDENVSVENVLVGPTGLVAVGTAGSGNVDAAIWTSADGDAWTRSTSPTLGGERFQGAKGGVAADDRLVVGGSANVGESEDAAVWTSADGEAWELVESDASVFGGSSGEGIDQIVEGGGRLLAVGRAGAGSGAVELGLWVSDDGTTWERASTDGTTRGSYIPQVTGVAVTSEAAVVLARLVEFDAASASFEVRDLGVYVGVPR